MAHNLKSLNADLNWAQSPNKGDAKLTIVGDGIEFNSGDTAVLNVMANALSIDAKASFEGDDYKGVASLSVPALSLSYDSVVYVNQKSLTTTLPVQFNMANRSIGLDKASIDVDGQTLNLDGTASFADDYKVDVAFSTPQWNIEEVLKLVPNQFASLLKDIHAKGGVEVTSGRIHGLYNDSTMPMIDANVQLHTAEFKYNSFPYTFKQIDANVLAEINLNDISLTRARIEHLSADVQNSHVVVDGNVENIINDARLLLNVKGDMLLTDLQKLLPNDLKLAGRAKAKLKTDILLSQITNSRWEQMKINGPIDATALHLVYNDSIIVDTEKAHIDLAMPSKTANKHFQEFLQTAITFNHLNANMIGTGRGELNKTQLSVGISNPLKDEPLSLRVEFNADNLSANTDTLAIAAQQPKGCVYMKPKGDATMYDITYHNQSLNVTGDKGLKVTTLNLGTTVKAVYDTTKTEFLDRWQPVLSVQLNKGTVKSDYLTMDIDAPRLDCFFSKRQLIINKSKINIGGSDFAIEGGIHNIEKWLDNKGLLTGEIDLTSNTTDVYELMDFVSGMGGDEEQTLEATQGETENPEDNPFMVPWGTDLTLRTNVYKARVGDSEFHNVRGSLRVKDGVMVLDEMGFTCDAATMQLTAMYRSPRRNHLFLGMNFHLLDIEVDKLIDMIPEIDTIVPMLSSFKGKAEFHLAAETYLKSDYSPKYSTLRGAAAIDGHDLVLMDSETFAHISKLLMFNRKTENKVDSLSLEMTVFRNEVELYPFLIQMDKYKAVVAGRYDLTPHYDAHIETLAPIRLALKVNGGEKCKFKLTKTQYANMYKPEKRNAVQERILSLKKLIADSLKATVKDEEYFE